MAEFISIDVVDAVATVRLSRPPANALSTQVTAEIAEAAWEISGRSDIRAVVFYGGPKIFAAGADINEMGDLGLPETLHMGMKMEEAFRAVTRIPQPTIAAVTGYALGGGCELALCCDFRVCADNSKLGLPEILLGVIPGAGGTQRLPRLIGGSRALELILSGRFVGAAEALDIGLVTKVVPADDTYEAALEMAQRFARGPALAMRAAKEAVWRGMESDLATGIAIERYQFASLFHTNDRAIGIASFVANGPGKAEFTGT